MNEEINKLISKKPEQLKIELINLYIENKYLKDKIKDKESEIERLVKLSE